MTVARVNGKQKTTSVINNAGARTVSKIDSMKRTFFVALACAALAAVPVAQVVAQNSSTPATKTAIFAGGCFWCIQPAFDKAQGVIKTNRQQKSRVDRNR